MDCLDENLNGVIMGLELMASAFSLTNELVLKMNRFIKQLKIVQKKLRFLRHLYVSEINSYVDPDKLEGLETRIQFMANNVEQLFSLCWAYEDEYETGSAEDEDDTDSEKHETDSNDDDILRKLPYLLCLVVIVELEMQKIFLGELKASKFSQSTTFKDNILPKGFSHYLRNLLVYLRNEKLKNFPTNVTACKIDMAIEFLLVFLGDVPNHVINGERLNEVLENIGVLVGDILCIIQMLLAGSTIKEGASKIDLGTIQILEKIEHLKAQVEQRYKSLKYSSSNEFPTVGGLSFLDSLLRKLNEMLKSKSSLDFMMKPHIGILEEDLSYLTSVFRDVINIQHTHDEIKDLQRRTVNLAYEAEVSIDSIPVQCNALWHFFGSLPEIIKEIKNIRVKVTEIVGFQSLPIKPFSMVGTSKYLPTQHSNPVNDDEIVGFENEREQIIQYLIRGTNELDVIPIVGMGGQGKTTIARNVYSNGMIVSHFDVRAWCIISQTYDRIDLLQDIFSQVTGSKDKVDEVGTLADMLRKRLMGRRYLIVLDDMWDVTAWEDLILSFPNDEKRSRIVVTTRLENLGKQVKYHTDPYPLPFLPPEESCELLQQKVFQQEGCPSELYNVSLEIAKNCKGLPLVIILVAGIIKRNRMEASWWHEVKDALFEYLDHDSEEFSLSTMQLSYDKLPDHLRPCLLYMGMFPEDAIIPVFKLISLWIAEGFIESGRLMEEAAEGYLNDLISSNVVMVSRRDYNGKVKYCQVHDMMLHFCLDKSREEKFILTMTGHDSHFQPSEWNESRVCFNLTDKLSKFASPGSKRGKPFHQHLRSLIMPTKGVFFYKWNPFSQVSEMRLLKVLDMGDFPARYLSSATLKPLIHLKYLIVSPDRFNFHPEPHLPHLETLIVNSSNTLLPASFWKMEKLRRFEIGHGELDLEEDKQGILEESSKLENLRILKNVEFPIDRIVVLSRRCPNLQELHITFKDSAEICPNFECLTQLQILSLSFRLPEMVSGLHLPSNLKKLVLKRIPVERAISLIGGLPILEYLKLEEPWYGALYSGIHIRDWCLGDVTFHNLKVLKLDYLSISRWDASEESFPQLETLVIKQCYKLKEIPLSFADISSLKQIKLIGCCNKSLEVSAWKINEEIEAIEGCDRLNVIIEGDPDSEINAASKDDSVCEDDGQSEDDADT